MQSKIGNPLTRLLAISNVVFYTNLIFTCAFTNPVLADAINAPPEDYQVHYIPKGRSCTVAGKDYRCFSFDDTRILLWVDYQFGLNTFKLKEMEEIVLLKDQQFEKRGEQLELQLENVGLLRDEISRLGEKWEKSDKELAQTSVEKAMWRSWTFLGIGGGILIGIIGGLVISKSLD